MSTILDRIRSEKVEWKKLGEVCEIKRGRVISKKYLEENKGNYPVYSSQTLNNGEIGRIETYDFNGEYVTWTTDGAYAGTVFYREGKFSITNICGLIKEKVENINLKFIYYWLQMETKNHVRDGSGNPKLMSNVMSNIKIPIPSLETQEKIVEILDKFTKYVTELQAELQFRIQQYEYYRDMTLSEKWLLKETEKLNKYIKLLLSGKEFSEEEKEFVEKQCKYYKDKILNDFAKLEWKTVGDLVNIIVGGDVPKNNFSKTKTKEYNIPIYSNGKEEEALYGYTNVARVNEESITISARGTIGYTSYRTDNYYPIVRLLCLTNKTENLNLKYLYYYLTTIKYNYVETGIPSLTSDKIRNIKAPLPSKTIQNKVVEILDKFEEILSNTKGLLPHEIELRRKQYKYYREKILTFKEKYDRVPSSEFRVPSM